MKMIVIYWHWFQICQKIKKNYTQIIQLALGK